MKCCKLETEREREKERKRDRDRGRETHREKERDRERSLDSLKTFKRYTDIFKKQLCLIFFYFPF